MAPINLVVIGASAGGLQGLLEILAELPADLGAPIVAVLHTPPGRESNLANVLSRGGKLPASFVSRDQILRDGHVYVAPPDFHVLVTEIGATLNHGPKENGFRPAIDTLFRTAAKVHGRRVMGVILSGALDDGVYGLKLIKDAGGVVVVQDPDDAVIQSLPATALQYVAADHVLDPKRIAQLIAEMTAHDKKGTGAARPHNGKPDPVEGPSMTIDDMEKEFGSASALSCPDCGGALWEIVDGQLVRYRCHVGHQYSPAGLDSGQHDVVETALWTAVRVLEEHADLRSRMSRRADLAGLDTVSTGFAASAQTAHQQAQAIRDVLLAGGPSAVAGRSAQLRPAVSSRRGSRTRSKKAKKRR